jgi:N-acetylglutamate synthase/N-acetylornithine aminotransferase
MSVFGVLHAHVTHVVGVVGVSRMVVTISMRVRFRAARAAAIVIAESGLVVVMYRIDGNFGSIICIVGTS